MPDHIGLEGGMWSADWDGANVVGGDRNLRLTPSFRLKEFRDANGGLRVHRELRELVASAFRRKAAAVAVSRDDSRNRLAALSQVR
jgi:hypothetical protein